MNQLTKKQADILKFIESHTAEYGFAPSFRKIADQFGVTGNAIQSHIELIKQKGYLKARPGEYNGLKVIRSTSEIPIYGKVAAGKPIFAIENIDGYVDNSLDKKTGLFALRVTGDSMIEAGIIENDVVIVKKQSTAQDKDIVIAMLDEEATVKRYRVKRGKQILEPANSKYQPIESPFEIIGKVIESRRKY